MGRTDTTSFGIFRAQCVKNSATIQTKGYDTVKKYLGGSGKYKGAPLGLFSNASTLGGRADSCLVREVS